MSTPRAPSARRITGRHLLLHGPGAVVDVDADDADRVRARIEAGLSALGWPGAPRERRHAGGVTLGVHASPDVLEAAADLLEWAGSSEGDDDLAEIVRHEARARDPRLRALWDAYPGLVLVGEGLVTVGMGRHARTWRDRDLPEVSDVGPVRGIPLAMITGTNGKTTTTRLLAHLAAQAGVVVGHTSSDGVVIDGETVERGDWTGPGAARRVLRDRRVQVGVLETARGGILRRGLVTDGADVAIVTNVTSEHLGEWGVDDLLTMARAKLVLADGLRRGGTLVVSAVSEPLAAVLPEVRARRPDLVIRTFASAPVLPKPDAWAGTTFLHVGAGQVPLAEIPITFGGSARHNVENAAAATLAAQALGVPDAAISRGLRTFRPSVTDNPGRMNTYRLPTGALAVIDFAHTSDGLFRIAETIRDWPKRRRTLLIGQAGDRRDEDLVALGEAGGVLAPHRVVVKEVTERLHGRPHGEVPALIRRGLLAGGISPGAIADTPDEVSGIRLAIRGATHDDVIVLLIHETLAVAVSVLEQAGAVPVD